MRHNSIRFTLIMAFHILFMLSSCLTLFLFLRWASAYLEVSHSFEESRKILSAFIGFLGWSMAGSLILGVIGLFFIISWIMRPVLNLANVADAISAGNLDERAKERGRRDEVGVLARSINLMADKLTGQLLNL